MSNKVTTSDRGEEANKYFELGKSHLFASSPNYEAAESSFRSAIELAVDWGEPYHFLCHCLTRRCKFPEAYEVGMRAIDLLPHDARPVIGLGRCLALSGDWLAAANYLKRGIAMQPHYGEADAKCMLAECLERSGDLQAAKLVWDDVLCTTPTYPSYEMPQAEAKARLSDYASSFSIRKPDETDCC